MVSLKEPLNKGSSNNNPLEGTLEGTIWYYGALGIPTHGPLGFSP